LEFDQARHARYASYAVLFLDWETRFPDEWREAGKSSWSPWTAKEGILWRFTRYGVPVDVRPAMTDLVVAGVSRPYRCKDWMYASMARGVDGPNCVTG
jgi:hypothetical protein